MKKTSKPKNLLTVSTLKVLQNGVKEHGKLPAKFKKTWVKALRSGKYKQGPEALRDVNIDTDGKRQVTYCCLGVACHVAGATGITGRPLIENDYDRAFPQVIKSINKVPKILRGSNGVPNLLANLNDNKAATFDQIADIIEEHL